MTHVSEVENAEITLEGKPLSISEQIRGLEIILRDSLDESPTIYRSYVLEKLMRIRNGTMNFHPLIKVALVRERLETKQEVSDD